MPLSRYSEDAGSKEKKGDVGWDKLTTFVDSYQTALEGLNKGDVGEVVESTMATTSSSAPTTSMSIIRLMTSTRCPRPSRSMSPTW